MNEMNEATEILRYYPANHPSMYIGYVWFGSGTELCNYDETPADHAGSSTNKPSMAVRNLCDRHNHRRRLRC